MPPLNKLSVLDSGFAGRRTILSHPARNHASLHEISRIFW